MFDEVKYLTYLNDKEFMECGVADILKHKNEYHSFSNAECAKATYDYLLLRCPDAMFFECCGDQFICATKKAAAMLHSTLDKSRNRLVADLSDITNAIKNIESSRLNNERSKKICRK